MKFPERYRLRANGTELPLLRLQAFFGLKPLTSGIIFGSLISLVVLLPVFIYGLGVDGLLTTLPAALFFGSSIAILSGFASPVFRGARSDLTGLGPVLRIHEDELLPLAESLTRVTSKQLALYTVIGVFCGLIHAYLLGILKLPAAYAICQCLAIMLLWTTMFWTVPSLIMNAVLFASLGQEAKPDLLRPSRQAGFGAAALRPALFLIATLCAYPLLLMGDKNGFSAATLIGAFASLAALSGIIALPLRGIRKRINEERSTTLAALDNRLDAITGSDIASADAAALFELDALLDIRTRVATAPGWPIDLAGVKKILLYLVLPPVTWAAAALVEMFINEVL